VRVSRSARVSLRDRGADDTYRCRVTIISPDAAPTASAPTAPEPTVVLSTLTESVADEDSGISVVAAPSPDLVHTVDEPEPTRSLTERMRAIVPTTWLPKRWHGLTGLGGILLGGLVVGLGAVVDLALGNTLGLGFTATFLLGCALIPLALRVRALATAVVLPPLLFAGAQLLQSRADGRATGQREMALDVATSLAISAPVLFAGTGLTLAIVLGRLVVVLVRR
jgi:hypothetical protein